MKEIKFRMLRPSEIELRPAVVKDGKCTLLCYMNSRVVTDLLDETIGPMNWCSEFQAIDGKVICKIGIWDEDKKMFVYKSDTGSESNIEAEKGQFSDCYKRCLSRWGVNELYTAPNITIPDDGYGNRGYYVSTIRYDESSRSIVELHIKNKFDKEIFNWKYGENKNPTEQKQEPKQTKQPIEILVEFCRQEKSKGTDNEQLTKFYRFYEKKINDGWNGQFNVSKLWENWVSKERKPRPSYNDASIQEYEEHTLGADDESFYY